MYGLLLKLSHIQPGLHRSRVMENILLISSGGRKEAFCKKYFTYQEYFYQSRILSIIHSSIILTAAVCFILCIHVNETDSLIMYKSNSEQRIIRIQQLAVCTNVIEDAPSGIE